MQRALGFRLLALWQLGEHVRGLVHPAALLARSRPDLAGGLPEPECAIGDDEPRGRIEPAPLQIKQQRDIYPPRSIDRHSRPPDVSAFTLGKRIRRTVD